MKRLATLLLIVGMATLVHANVVTIKLTSLGGHSYEGFATYAYKGIVDGEKTLFMCDTFHEHAKVGESWQADVMTVPQYGTFLGSLHLAQEEAFLYLMAKSDNGVPSYVNAVAWYVLEGAPSLTAPAQALYNTVSAMTFDPDYGSGVVVYVPLEAEGAAVALPPQTFVSGTPTPEPSTLTLLGSTLVIGTNVIRKRFMTGAIKTK